MTCANPRCFRYPMRGAMLCGTCSTRRDALFLVGILAGGLSVFVAIVHFFGVVKVIH